MRYIQLMIMMMVLVIGTNVSASTISKPSANVSYYLCADKNCDTVSTDEYLLFHDGEFGELAVLDKGKRVTYEVTYQQNGAELLVFIDDLEISYRLEEHASKATMTNTYNGVKLRYIEGDVTKYLAKKNDTPTKKLNNPIADFINSKNGVFINECDGSGGGIDQVCSSTTSANSMLLQKGGKGFDASGSARDPLTWKSEGRNLYVTYSNGNTCKFILMDNGRVFVDEEATAYTIVNK